MKSPMAFDEIKITLENGKPKVMFCGKGHELWWIQSDVVLVPGDTFSIKGITGESTFSTDPDLV